MSTVIGWLAAALADFSPKVKAGLNWGVLASLALALLNSVNQGDLAFLGKWEPLAWALIPILIAAVAAWAKEDPARAAGLAILKAPSFAPAPDVALTTTAPNTAGDEPIVIQKDGTQP